MDRPPSPQQQHYHGSGTCSDSGAVPQTGRDESTKRRASHQLVHTTWTAPKTDRNCSVTNKLLRKQSEAATWQTAPKTNRNCRVTNKLHSASGAVRPVTQSLTFQSRDCTYGLWRKRWHSSLGTAPPYLRPAYSRNHVSVTLALTPALISTVKLYLLWLPTLASACSRFLISVSCPWEPSRTQNTGAKSSLIPCSPPMVWSRIQTGASYCTKGF